ncbi:hypothetical protein [Arthrobacter sp. HLT1-20]
MQIKVIAVAAWVMTGLIGVLGLNAATTIWFYMEPVVDTVPDPASYYVAVTVGLLALLLSLAVSLGATIHVTRCEAIPNAQSAQCH